MIETAFNAVWLALAAGVLIAIPRCTPKTRVALLCGLALLFPVISISDDFNATTGAADDAIAIAAVIVLLVAFNAIARVHTATEPLYTLALTTPSDPRSPPQSR